MNNLLISAAYKYVAMAVMLMQANQFLDDLHPTARPPITRQDLRPGGHVAPPHLMGFSGSLLTTNYFFGFSNGRLANFKKTDFLPENQTGFREKIDEYARMKSVIGTNEVYQLARGWLAALSVDVAQMEKKHPPKITQLEFAPDHTGKLETERRPLPLFQIDWGSISMEGHGPEYNMPAVSMIVFGPTKELVEFHMIDDTFVSKPKIQIPDSEKLLAISDEKFKGFSDTERSNLITQAVAPKP